MSEALASLGLRPARTVLTMLGTILGVGSFVAVVGLTATAAGQISADFSAQQATIVQVNDAGTDPLGVTVYSFPADADQRVERLNGVLSAGVSWTVTGNAFVASAASAPSGNSSIGVLAASRGFIQALLPTWSSGSSYTQFQENNHLPVVVLGEAAARQLGVPQSGVTVTINGFPYLVVGILESVETHPEVLASALLPVSTAMAGFGAPQSFSPATMIIRTDLGAAQQVAQEAAQQLRPDNPSLMAVIPPAEPPRMASLISQSMEALLAGLGLVTLLIGGAAIANTTFVSVMERVQEIGLRRALGASRLHVVAQLLIETGAIGFVAGLVGASLGLLTVICVAVAFQWTAVIDTWVILAAPIIGAGVGLLAGFYPALRAGQIEPIQALRR